MTKVDNEALATALQRCEEEPIQLIGSIQRHVAPLDIREFATVTDVSANPSNIVDAAAMDTFGQCVTRVLGGNAGYPTASPAPA
jgi:light-regulated signal transduction histidine kinase (bacteriophytochrome)